MSKRNRISKLQRDYLDELSLMHGVNVPITIRQAQPYNWRRMIKSLERQGHIRVSRPLGDEYVTHITVLEP